MKSVCISYHVVYLCHIHFLSFAALLAEESSDHCSDIGHCDFSIIFFQHAQRIKSQLSKIKKSLIKTAQSSTHLRRENSMIGKENSVVIENTSKPTWHLEWTSRIPWTKNYLLKKQLFCRIKNCAENFTLTQWFKLFDDGSEFCKGGTIILNSKCGLCK